MGGILCSLVNIYSLLVFARVLLSWFPITPGTAMASVANFVSRLVDPVLDPLRRLLPPARMGAMAFDLSPIILLLGLQLIVGPIICSL